MCCALVALNLKGNQNKYSPHSAELLATLLDDPQQLPHLRFIGARCRGGDMTSEPLVTHARLKAVCERRQIELDFDVPVIEERRARRSLAWRSAKLVVAGLAVLGRQFASFVRPRQQVFVVVGWVAAVRSRGASRRRSA